MFEGKRAGHGNQVYKHSCLGTTSHTYLHLVRSVGAYECNQQRIDAHVSGAGDDDGDDDDGPQLDGVRSDQ